MGKRKSKNNFFNNPINVLLSLFLCGGLLYVIVFSKHSYQNHTKSSDIDKSEQAINTNLNPDKPKTTLKNFSPAEFKEYYDNTAYPNTRYIDEDTVITGNRDADIQIQKIAEARGYKRRSAPVMDNFVKFQNNEFSLQQKAADDWIKMVDAAKKDNIYIKLNAGYRSSEDQRKIFLERLNQKSIVISRISTGIYDSEINSILATTAIPGYSRHHTGYTVDIGCENQPYQAFQYTICFKWLETDNYRNAKTYGWIPSYPEGAEAQGPEPESWEYVWVGTDATFE